MGKHERGLIENAEKIIVKILNSQQLSNADRKNRWIDHIISIAQKIKNDFPNITSAHHLGNRYDNTGDILIISNNKEFFIEVKMSDQKLGIGTKANISQDALTENHLFQDDVVSWSEFRRKKNHNKWVNEFLDQFIYPQKILKVNSFNIQKEEKARYLRNLQEKNNKRAKKVIDDIKEKDRKEKMEYLIYLSNKKQQPNNIKKFFILILLGVHSKEILNKLMKNTKFFQEIQDLTIYYANSNKRRITVRKENVGNKIKRIVKDYSDFKIIFPKKVTHCKIVGSKNRKQVSLLQIVFHWKNIFQGIKTPCLNIFDLTRLL